MFRKTVIAATAALTLAAAVATPADAMSRRGKVLLGLGIGTAIGLGIAGAARANDGYYYDDYRYNGRRYCRRAAEECSYSFRPGSWRFDRCLRRAGC